MKVEVYGKDSCVYTQSALQAFDSMNIPVNYIRLSQNTHGNEISRLTKTQSTTVPVIIIDGKWIGGFDELKKIMNESWHRTVSKYASHNKSF